MTHTLTLQTIEPVTHDTYHLVFDRPEGFEFTPGQATDLALDQDGWRDEYRPFTFTSLPGDDSLEFVIKSYPEHDGVTKRIAALTPGDTVTIKDPWGAIHDEGDGVFIAGGAGVTPFISILRAKLAAKGNLAGNTLLFSNQTDRDIILKDQFEAMTGLDTRWIVTDQPGSPYASDQIGVKTLKQVITPGQDVCYVCGPDPMVEAMPKLLEAAGVPEAQIITEDFS
ncbi:FAD-binding oxidoreductase [Tropicibacter naphthalenivorans]|uniref:3-ketosteroid-9-alpha-hydroxylase reductase subunit n=1 Tax=Tropicibacter naphthalenivorans TaxID=441103 RepID=A0A0N7LZT0_9RHOB|nr:FAD-binding oxidoreductase [Tropicibacter naphthalenivorans]CUH78521.1 3-ketosteroid-9-alpha-hydroxylase reductase subunit [Tropicibacter naphthalenivorans]SMC80840.1 Oxidoreductase FAD-binding domain-containing protein [Tropicibacter naphthalenivorans]